MLDELPALIAAGYEQVDEEDIVRLKWWGLYHDKPKIGTFMLRVKIPGGITSPAQLRAIGEISNALRARRRRAEHAAERAAPFHRARRAARRLRPAARGRADLGRARAATRCATSRAARSAGLAHDELFDPTPVLEEAAAFFYGNPDYSDLPRKHKIAITACPRRVLRARDQLHRPDRRDPRRRRGLRRARRRRALVGAADRARPRDLGAEGGGGRRARGDPRRVARGPALPRLAGQGAAEVHDRRHRARGPARADRGPSRSHVRRLRAAAAAAGAATTSACTSRPTAALRRRAGAPRARSAATRCSRSPTSPRASAATSA